MDKIVLMLQGSISITSGDLYKGFSHGLPFAPLIMGSWSLTPDFASSNEFTLMPYGSPSIDQLSLLATPSQVQFGGLFADGTTKTIYYRLYAFAPSDYSGDVVAPNVENGYRMDSRLNYMKLFAEGIATFSGSTPVIVNHNLGYKPMVLVWTETHGDISKLTSDDFDSTNGQFCNVTNTQIIMKSAGGFGYQKMHYRIYIDD